MASTIHGGSPPFAIRTEGLTRNFATVRAVDTLTMEVPPGIIFGFLGANGAGKTTTIHLLLGLLEPSSGYAEVLGLNTVTAAAQIRQQTGALLEYAGLYERLTAADNLDFFGRVWHMPRSERAARAKELLVHLDLWDRRKERVGAWSRGMKQKLAIARVLMHRPSLIFLDEPTAGLDPVAAAALRDDLAALASREGVTIFLTTHNLAEAERLCALVGVLKQGRLLALGSPNALRAESGAPRVEVVGEGFTPQALDALRARPDVAQVNERNGRLVVALQGSTRAAPVVATLVAAGAQIEEVHHGQASLEDVFLSLMEGES